MAEELEAAAADALSHLIGSGHGAPPQRGARCANCGALLQGRYCHDCGQPADTHRRSILHLAWEAIEGLLHLDGRLLRTLPDLFLRPGRLARDYMEGRIARHVPPFRTFLVALLLFIFAAEHATHELAAASQRQAEARAAALATPGGRAREAQRLRAEAAGERAADLAEAAKDRADDLKDPDEEPDKVQVRYLAATAAANTAYAAAQAKADRIAKGQPEDASAPVAARLGAKVRKRDQWWLAGLRKAVANPEFYLTLLFTWGHRLAILLLPIVGLSLAFVYRNKHRYFIYDHLLVAMNLLSFAFLAAAAGLILPPSLMLYGFGLVTLWTPINLFQTLRGGYGSSIIGATLKTWVVWFTTVFAFGLLLAGLLLFTLTQL